MKLTQTMNYLWMSGVLGTAAIALVAPSTVAAAKITDVQLDATQAGVDLVLQTAGRDRPQVLAVRQGKILTANITNAHLALAQKSFRQVNPAKGIASITVQPLSKDSVKVVVVGQVGAPVGAITRAADDTLAFQLRPSDELAINEPTESKTKELTKAPTKKTAPLKGKALAATLDKRTVILPLPKDLSRLPQLIAQAAKTPPQPAPAVVPVAPATRAPRERPVSTPAPSNQSPLPAFQGGAPLVANPTIQVEGKPYAPPPPVPPFAPAPLPRAIAPPVGDIAVGQIDATPGYIDLGTAERVPRLVLRDASSREVLSLLARSAGMNIVFTADQGRNQQNQQQQAQPGATADDGPKVTLDIVNEPIQNVFNYVLQITGLEASRRGNTIFVGPRLPNSARNVVVRSLRLNQVPVATALPFLVTMGAESAVSRERLVTAVNAVPITNISEVATGSLPQGQGQGQGAITQSQTTTEQRIEVQRVAYQDSTPILRGLQVSGDERTNTVTIVGEARKVEIAIAQLVQLDVRRRQVAVNVRVVDVDLVSFERLGSSFSFGVNDTQVVNTGGVAIVNFGQNRPSETGLSPGVSPGNPLGSPVTTFGGITSGANFARNFLLQIQAAVSNGSAKVLTDPTLLVQEGQLARVELGEEVVTNIEQTTTATQNSTTVNLSVEKAVAGLTLPISVNRIDDNGFISLSLAPLISRPQGVADVSFNTGTGNVVSNQITLLAVRRVESGQVRLRDGQTLVLTGIIQDIDRTTVTKVPILGDIPILGALFRRSETQNQRREVIVLLTPRILDDTDQSAFGYSYTPGSETQRILNNIKR